MPECDHTHGENTSNPDSLQKRNDHNGKKHIRAKAKNTHGSIYIERQIHDDAIVISGSLDIGSDIVDLNTKIAERLDAAALQINGRGGIVGHIKASVSTTSTCMVSVTEEKAMVKESPLRRVRITLAAILFLIDPADAENIIRNALEALV